jgi:NitT/TauT family transport system substrate-binding protein
VSLRSIRFVLGVLGLAFATAAVAQSPTRIKFILNWKYYGPQAWFFVAQDKGYFKAEGLEVAFDQGDGSPGAPTKVAAGIYDAGFGDLPTVIQLAAQRPVEAPIGVYMMYSNPPYVIATKKGSGIVKPRDLEGKTIGGPANDGALRLWPAFSKIAGIDTSKVKIENMASNLREQMLNRGQIDAAFGFIQTIWFSAKAIGMDPAKELHFIRYADYGLPLYSNSIVVSKKLARENPEAVKGLVRAINKAFHEVRANPDMGMDAVMKREPLLKREVEKERLLQTIEYEVMSSEMKSIGIGDVDEQRLKKGIDLLVESLKLPRTPSTDEVFSRAFLPARGERELR